MMNHLFIKLFDICAIRVCVSYTHIKMPINRMHNCMNSWILNESKNTCPLWTALGPGFLLILAKSDFFPYLILYNTFCAGLHAIFNVFLRHTQLRLYLIFRVRRFFLPYLLCERVTIVHLFLFMLQLAFFCVYSSLLLEVLFVHWFDYISLRKQQVIATFNAKQELKWQHEQIIWKCLESLGFISELSL